MTDFPNGVTRYTNGTVQITVHFPQDHVQCRYCPLFLKYEEAYKRYSCRLTHEWIFDPGHQIGEQCPLKMDTPLIQK